MDVGSFFGGDPLWFTIPFFLIILLIFAVVIFVIVWAIVKSAREKRNNEAAGHSATAARVFGKREEMRGGGETRIRTTYYLTFELEGGERKEFEVPSELYGLTAEGDTGTLRFMGTKFEGFDRHRNL
ncbi:hypothetical protein CDO73_22985 [Saccharibacillus sp. O23]|nr:hypothetical protein CDO73_22985 [Saccharibacillus sp. O23]